MKIKEIKLFENQMVLDSAGTIVEIYWEDDKMQTVAFSEEPSKSRILKAITSMVNKRLIHAR